MIGDSPSAASSPRIWRRPSVAIARPPSGGLDSIEGQGQPACHGQVLARDPDYVFKNPDAIARGQGV